jgi:hypothetical protein
MRALVPSVILSVALLAIAPAGTAASPPAKIVSRILGPDGGWDYVSLNPAAKRLYVVRSAAAACANGKAAIVDGHARRQIGLLVRP